MDKVSGTWLMLTHTSYSLHLVLQSLSTPDETDYFGNLLKVDP